MSIPQYQSNILKPTKGFYLSVGDLVFTNINHDCFSQDSKDIGLVLEIFGDVRSSPGMCLVGFSCGYSLFLEEDDLVKID